VVDHRALDEFIRRNARVKARAEQALRDNPNDIDTLCAVSALYDSMGDFAGAQKLADHAVAIAPDSADALVQRGVVLRHRGDFSAALASFQRALDFRPLAARAYHELARLGGLSNREDAFATLISVFDQVRAEPERALLAGHAIAKVLEDRGEYEASFDWLVRAKAGTARLNPYDQAEAEALHDAADTYLDPGRYVKVVLMPEKTP